MKKRSEYLSILLIILLGALSINARTLVNLATDVIGICAVANGCTGTATTDANKIFIGPASGSAAAPSFRIPAYWEFNVLPDLTNYRVSLFLANDDTATKAFGDTFTGAGTASQVAATSTNPAYYQQQTSTTNGNVAHNTGNLNTVVGRSIRWMFTWRAGQTGDRRQWAVLTDQTAATMGASDNPAGNWVGITYCNDGADGGCAADDTNFQFAVKDNTTKSAVDTGIVMDTNFHQWIIVEDPGVSFTLYHATLGGAYSQVAQRTTNLPTSGTPLRIVWEVTCTTCTPTAQNWGIARSELVTTY